MQTPSLPPLPPEALRRLVCHDDKYFDLDNTQSVVEGVSSEHHVSVLDFGCGCGRVARQFLVNEAKPINYVGIDINKEMIEWCQSNLAPLAPGWRFLHHDVFNKNLGPNNSPTRTRSFPVSDTSISLLIAHSVFTHLYLDQTIFYLHEIRRVLQAGGIAKTTWFLFDRRTFPMLGPDQVCLFINEDDPSNAVIYEWQWLRQAIRDAGLCVHRILPPGIPGHQWELLLTTHPQEKFDTWPSSEVLRAGLCAYPPERAASPTSSGVEKPTEAAVSGAKNLSQLTSASSFPPRMSGVLRFSGVASRAEFDTIVGQVPWWYHSYYFDNGFSIRGDYDIGADVDAYGFPSDMTGWNVLDVGAGAGWFSHYFAQNGANVVAVDARGYEDFDVYGRAGYSQISREPDMLDRNRRPIHFSPVNKAFWLMKSLLRSEIEFVNGRVYELPALFPNRSFDLVFMGALLCHLRDPIGALAAARQICTGFVVASTPVVIGEPESEVSPRQYLPYTDHDRISWWLPNEACFRHWFLAAGFSSADPGPEALLRCDKPRYSPEGKMYNGSQKIRIGRGVV